MLDRYRLRFERPVIDRVFPSTIPYVEFQAANNATAIRRAEGLLKRYGSQAGNLYRREMPVGVAADEYEDSEPVRVLVKTVKR